MITGVRSAGLWAATEPGLPEEMLRIGVQFADGSKATNTSEFHHGDGPPPAPVLRTGGGGGGDRSWHQNEWVWPLPPPGPLTFVCEWPAAGIALTRSEIDAQLILDAADRAQRIFPDSSDRGGASITGTIVTFGTASQSATPPSE
jgi:hypothetical protein